MRKNPDQKIFEYEHFSRSVSFVQYHKRATFLPYFFCFIYVRFLDVICKIKYEELIKYEKKIVLHSAPCDI